MSVLIAPPSTDPRSIVRILAEIATLTAETPELQEVFDRVAAAIRELISFDHMGVVRLLDPQTAVLHATTVPLAERGECSGPFALSSWSPRLRPRPGAIARIDDAAAELDPAFPSDAELMSVGVRSVLWEPFRSREPFTGGVWLSAHHEHAFTDEHQEVLVPVAALLGSAVEHWRIWDGERQRRERLDQLETRLGSLARSLDVREVFQQISDGVQEVLPHDALALTEHDEHAGTVRLAAIAGVHEGPETVEPVQLTEQEKEKRLLDHEIIRDVLLEIQPDTERNRLLLATGMRSWLRVPVRMWGEVRGSLGFFHREPGRFDAADVEVARRLADRVALTLCLRRLAEEQQAAAEMRERTHRLEATVETLTRELESQQQMRVVGRSGSWQTVLQQVARVAGSPTTVLITGESGTGKEVVSRLLHQGSPRAGRPFVAINCAALPEQLLESELFGYEKGAFTGAVATKVGRLEQAAGGTLFLDEIGEMSPLVQAKLLRVLQEREFQRLGGTRTLRAEVRLIAATNRDLAAAMARGQFRDDLYYRLNVFEIHVPPLRERSEDVLLLAQSFLDDLGRTMGRPAAGISRDARDWLLAYPWPGNVRELRNAIERAILLCDGGLITREHLPAGMGRSEVGPPSERGMALDPRRPLPAEGVDLEEVERGLVEKALEQTRGNRSRAARLLGLTRAQLYSRIEKYGLR